MNLYIEIIVGIWLFVGIIYLMFTADKWQVKPTHIGDLVIRLFFFPHSILMYIVHGLVLTVDKIATPIVNSNWWNKKL